MFSQKKSVLKTAAAVLLCMCMIASLFACGKNGGDAEDVTKEPTKTAEVTPGETETTPTQDVTPDAETTPTAAVTTPAETTPTPAETTPTPAVTGKAEVRKGDQYTIETVTYGDAKDPGRQSDITVKNTADDKVIFRATDYIGEHRSEWEANAADEVLDLTSHLGDLWQRGIQRETVDGTTYDIYMNEELLYRLDLGEQGKLGVYAHSILYFEPRENSELPSFLFGSYLVSCRLINGDMSQQYALLYEENVPGNSDEGHFRVDFYYANPDGTSDKYYPAATRRFMASVCFVKEDDKDNDYYAAGKFFGETDYSGQNLMTEELFAVSMRHDGKTGALQLGGTMRDVNGISRYSKMGQDWQILSYKLSDIANTLYHLQKNEAVTNPDVAKQIKNGVFAVSEPFETNTIADYTVRTEVSLEGNDAVIRLYYAMEKCEILVDECRHTVFDTFTSNSGETMEVTAGIVGQSDGYTSPVINDREVPELTLRHFAKGATAPSVSFETSAYLAENKAKFEKNAAAYEKSLRSEYKGTTIVKKNLLKEISLGEFGFLAIYEIAVYGETPEQIGDVNTLYHYRVVGVWVRNDYLRGSVSFDGDTTTVENVIFTAGNCGSATPEGAVDYVRIFHGMTKGVNVDALAQGAYGNVNEQFPIDTKRKPSVDDLFTVVGVGRYYASTLSFRGSYFQYNYDEQYFVNTTYVDAAGTCVLSCYDTYHESTDGYGISGGEVKDASGKVHYLYQNGGKDVKLMSYSMKQIVAAMIERGLKFEDVTINEKAPKELVDKVTVDAQKDDDGEHTYYTCVYWEKTKLDKNYELVGVVTVTDVKWYCVDYYLIRDGKSIGVFGEECMPFDSLNDYSFD